MEDVTLSWSTLESTAREVIQNGDISSLTLRSVRSQMEQKLGLDSGELDHRKKEVNQMVKQVLMHCQSQPQTQPSVTVLVPTFDPANVASFESRSRSVESGPSSEGFINTMSPSIHSDDGESSVTPLPSSLSSSTKKKKRKEKNKRKTVKKNNKRKSSSIISKKTAKKKKSSSKKKKKMKKTSDSKRKKKNGEIENENGLDSIMTIEVSSSSKKKKNTRKKKKNTRSNSTESKTETTKPKSRRKKRKRKEQDFISEDHDNDNNDEESSSQISPKIKRRRKTNQKQHPKSSQKMKSSINDTKRINAIKQAAKETAKMKKTKNNVNDDSGNVTITIPEEYERFAKSSEAPMIVTTDRGTFDLTQSYHKNDDGLYQCQFCEKSKRSKRDMIQHCRMHTGERPFKCTHCSKAFPTKSSWMVHEKRHAGIKAHECPLCDYAGVTTGDLSSHLLFAHKSTLPEHRCEDCSQCFYSSSHLFRHKRRAHGWQRSTEDNTADSSEQVTVTAADTLKEEEEGKEEEGTSSSAAAKIELLSSVDSSVPSSQVISQSKTTTKKKSKKKKSKRKV